MYADYNFYTTEYLGKHIPEDTFAAVERSASAYIDYITHNRISKSELPDWVMEKVKMAVCAVADVCYKQTNDEDSPTVSSESVGNHSKSYAVMNKGFDNRQHEKLVQAKTYLHGTGLLYGGLR
jgi:hypothetical protein